MGEKIRKATKYIGVIIAGLLQGTLGNYFAIVKLRKSKMYLVSFLIAWFIGSIGLFVFFFIH